MNSDKLAPCHSSGAFGCPEMLLNICPLLPAFSPISLHYGFVEYLCYCKLFSPWDEIITQGQYVLHSRPVTFSKLFHETHSSFFNIHEAINFQSLDDGDCPNLHFISGNISKVCIKVTWHLDGNRAKAALTCQKHYCIHNTKSIFPWNQNNCTV